VPYVWSVGWEGTEGAVKLFESGEGFDAVNTEKMAEPLATVYVQPRDDAGSVSDGIRRWFVGGLIFRVDYISDVDESEGVWRTRVARGDRNYVNLSYMPM
jgi:hypothetical protein